MNHNTVTANPPESAIYAVNAYANSVPPPREPGPTDRARELLAFLRELEGLQAETRKKLYGPFPEPGESLGKRTDEPCLDEILAVACQKAAMAVSEQRNILNRL